MEKKDVFISHAREDKDTYVYPLADAFKSLGITYWLDEAEIRWGDSILQKISEGINNSRYVLVLLTEHFISKPWPEKELNAALHIEINSGEIVVLPVLIVSRELFLKKFILMIDKCYLDWEKGPKEIAQQLLQLLGRQYKNDWEHNYPMEYTGKVWIRVMRRPSSPANMVYQYQITWGPWEYKGQLSFEGDYCISLWHTKGKDELSIPIFFHIFPECYVTFGTGNPLDNSPININNGWRFIEKENYNFFKRTSMKFHHFLRKSSFKKSGNGERWAIR